MNEDRQTIQIENFRRRIIIIIDQYLNSSQNKLLFIKRNASIILITVTIVLYFLFEANDMGQRFVKLQAESQFWNKTLLQNQAQIAHLQTKNCQLQTRIFSFENKIMQQTKQISDKIELYFNMTDKMVKQKNNFTKKLEFELEIEKQRTIKLFEVINTLNGTLSNHQERINMLIENELSKEIKEHNFIVSNSQLFTWKIYKQNQDYFKIHYTKTSENPLTIMKNSNQNKYILTQVLFQEGKRSFFSVRIQKSFINDFSVGLYTKRPKTIYYFYGRNNKIYKGSAYDSASAVKYSNSEFKLNANDTITVFYDGQLRQIVWYVNKKYVSHIGLHQANLKYVYPFIFLHTKGDTISIL